MIILADPTNDLYSALFYSILHPHIAFLWDTFQYCFSILPYASYFFFVSRLIYYMYVLPLVVLHNRPISSFFLLVRLIQTPKHTQIQLKYSYAMTQTFLDYFEFIIGDAALQPH